MRPFPTLLVVVLMLLNCRAAIDRQGEWERVKVIDMHAHVFNSRDIPLEGILSRFHVLWPVNVVLAEILQLWTPIDDGSDFVKRTASANGTRPLLQPEQRDILERHVRIKGDELIRRHRSVTRLTNANDREATEDELLVAQALHDADFPPGETDPDKAGNRVASARGAGLDGYLRFIWIMTRPHENIARTLSETYPQTDLFVHHMMDMDKVYGTSSATPFHVQVVRAQKLDAAAQGKLAHFAAFDPFRRADAMEFVELAYKNGALGLKFYPPSGYRPTQNFFPRKPGLFQNRDGWNSRYDGWQPKHLDEVIDKVFQWALGKDFPLFAHCTPFGFQGAAGYGMRCDPYYWGKYLEKPGNGNLRLCLGHAGGEYYWFSDPDDDKSPNRQRKLPIDIGEGTNATDEDLWHFGAQAVQLALNYPNVYLDLGYLEPVLTEKGRTQLIKRLTADLKKPTKDGKKLGDKIVYGSDWHQLHKEDDYTKYLESWDLVLREVDKGDWRKKILSGNALEFLRLKQQMSRPEFAQQRTEWAKLYEN